MLARGSPPRSKRQRSRLEGGGRLIATSATTTLLRRPCYEGIGWNITYLVTGGLYDESKFRSQVDFRSLAEVADRVVFGRRHMKLAVETSKQPHPQHNQPRGHFIQQSLDVHHEHSLPLNYLALPSTGPCHLPRAKYGSSFPYDFRDRMSYTTLHSPSRHKSHTWCSGPMLERANTFLESLSRDDEALPPHAPQAGARPTRQRRTIPLGDGVF
ncbi:hypothetical protein NEUTE1DRAFT_102055 [Neurospora tetrasperma FGSC 2508]|uniref:Uncharacterized protein n=1 Tax=Neurospora tetrasperma (strain FGSC 2508 / ATCC MYA-4615 / P0657) TaxID=510951 RepID=F8MR10_NEUT8|nr:uncharacterized protein NEUTE1DRAFT_102055 [Neurospora tetrasperma FGSC 2508]EGO56790.1 hypothetical protein NEUTE1DRAFT_102055 [Neurospora tetrasperma FGSC 2508]EGZ70323.1 hypothetical protein NEUTE2DRAFT_68635 [Neurospora tetrasperma FGSC 2509]